MIAKSTSTSTSRRGFERSARQERGRRAGVGAARALLEVAEEAGELDEDDERHEHADCGHPRVGERVVRERGRAEERRQQRQRGDGLLLREAVVDEAVRRVVGAALGDRPPLECPADRHERRVEDRDREHEQRQQDARQRRPGGRPARRERERGEPEADHLAAGVAHEDDGLPAGAEVERQEADAGAAECERDDEHELARVARRDRVDGEHGARDRGQRRGEPVHVVEQVEGVRDPDEPDRADRRSRARSSRRSRPTARREHDSRRGELGRELQQRAEREDVVGSPATKRTRAACEDSEQLRASARPRRRRPRAATPATKPAKMPTPPKMGVARSCQRSPVGSATSRSPRWDAQQRPEDESRDGEGRERDDRAHETEA